MLKPAPPVRASVNTQLPIGSLGHLTIFVWALVMALLPAQERGLFAALLALVVLGTLYPFTIQRLFKPRWLLILGSLFLVSLFFGRVESEPDWMLWGFPISSINLLNSARMLLRAVIILMAADGLSASVNITEMAGMLERGGLRGLGFSLGVAFNLLPDLRRSSTATWHSLRMRGGLRAQWPRGLQLLLVTILTNSLRHAEEIVLAAEVRAFRPERSRVIPIKTGKLDGWLVVIGALVLVGILLFPKLSF